MRDLAIAAAIVTGVLVAGAAPATIYTYVVTGAVNDAASYGTSLFGPLTGASFAATFRFDDQVAGAVYQSGPLGSSAQGGDLYAPGTLPPLAELATLQIGGTTVIIPQGDFHQSPYYDQFGEPYGEQIDEADLGRVQKDATERSLGLAAGYSNNYAQYLTIFGYGYSDSSSLDFTLVSADLTDPGYGQLGSYALLPSSFGSFYFASTYTSRQYQTIDYGAVSLSPASLVVTSTAVPEPETWMMMAIGLGAIGQATRRWRLSGRPALPSQVQ